MKQLLVFRRFTHDSQGVLTAVHRFALVKVELFLNIWLRVEALGRELSIAAFANSHDWHGLSYDPKRACWHECSLAHLAGRA